MPYDGHHAGYLSGRRDIDRILEGRATLERLAGTRGAFVNALNASFLEAAITPFAESLGNLVVFTVYKETNFAGTTVSIEVDGLDGQRCGTFRYRRRLPEFLSKPAGRVSVISYLLPYFLIFCRWALTLARRRTHSQTPLAASTRKPMAAASII